MRDMTVIAHDVTYSINCVQFSALFWRFNNNVRDLEAGPA
mgnify:CR=1 FL=1